MPDSTYQTARLHCPYVGEDTRDGLRGISGGFTMVEIIIVVVIIAIAALAAVPMMSSAASIQIRSAANMIAADLEYAKSMAISRGQNFSVEFDENTESYSIEDQDSVVIQHPVTTEFENAYYQMQETLKAVCTSGIPTIIFWPNVDAGSDAISKAIREFREKYKLKDIHFFRNFTPEDFLALLLRSKCIMGNSSVGIRECSFLGVPAVNIGTRQSGREQGENVINVPYSKEDIMKALKKHFQNGNRYPSIPLYGDGTAGGQIAEILEKTTPTTEKRFIE